MQSESSTLKKIIRKVLPAKVDQPLTPQAAHLDLPSSSQPIGGTGTVDTAMSAIEASLAALNVASVLITKIPSISPVAGLLLQALTMRTEVKQYKEEWGVVMVKLEQVAGLVDNIGTFCGKYDLEDELDGINAALKQSQGIGSIKQILLRKDLQQKVKQYDSKLSNVVQRFQVTLALDTRFAQLADQKGNKVARSGPSDTVMSVLGEFAITMLQSVRHAPAVTVSVPWTSVAVTLH